MRLFHTGPSPYGRKVLATAFECGVWSRIETLQTNPHESGSGLLAHNPLSKVPVLVRDDGTVLYDSLLICEYLDSLHDGPPLIPAEGEAKWTSKRRQVLANGIIDCSVTRRVEGWRASEPDRTKHVQRQIENTGRALDAFEAEAAGLPEAVTLDQISLGCALGFLDFRFPDDQWRQGRPALADWFAGFSQRPSMRATEPHDPA